MVTVAEAFSTIRRDTDRSTMVFPGEYLSLTTYRRDGSPVATPVGSSRTAPGEAGFSGVKSIWPALGGSLDPGSVTA
jgi:hypothetical protein